MDGGFDRGRDRGRGRGSPRSTPNRSGGRQFMGSGAQSHRRHDLQQRVYSRGRREKFQAVYVAKTQEGQNSSEAVNGVSEVNSAIASDLPHNGNSPPLTSPLGSSLSTGEEKTQIGETSKEVKYDVTITSHLSIKEEISQQVEICLPPKHGDEDVPLSIKSLKTPASDRKFENSESSAVFEPFDICLAWFFSRVTFL